MEEKLDLRIKIAIRSHKPFKFKDLPISTGEKNDLLRFYKYVISEDSSNEFLLESTYKFKWEDTEFIPVVCYDYTSSKLQPFNDAVTDEKNVLPRYFPIKVLRAFKEGDIIKIYKDNDISLYFQAAQLSSKFGHYGAFELALANVK